MNSVILFNDTKWQGFSVYDAQVGTTGMGLVMVDPDRPYSVGQNVQFAVYSLPGTLPWQNGQVSAVSDECVTIFATD